MGKSQPKYTPEFRRQMVLLYRSGRGFNDLAAEFGVTSWRIRQWVKRFDRDAGTGDVGLTGEERPELTRLRRENRQLREEREILSIATAWFAKASTATPKCCSDS
jgi:transposase